MNQTLESDTRYFIKIVEKHDLNVLVMILSCETIGPFREDDYIKILFSYSILFRCGHNSPPSHDCNGNNIFELKIFG